jgi:hypothetical protein
MLEKFKNDVEKQQAEQMTGWQAKLVMMDSKDRQYILQVSNYKVSSICDSNIFFETNFMIQIWSWLQSVLPVLDF